MHYRSTRDLSNKSLTFEDVVMRGIAEDGGLFVPEQIPQVSAAELASLKNASYTEVAFFILSKFIAREEIPESDLRDVIDRSYSTFSSAHVTPLVDFGDGMFLLEQFHGPTCAFKDVALQFLGNLFEYFLNRRNSTSNDQTHRITVLGATSGDTGGAAIYGLRGKSNTVVMILHPSGRVAPVQEAQMTSVLDANVVNVAVKGTFDDCQDIVKACFADPVLREEVSLAAINSINWARILAQTVYFFYAYLRWLEMSPNRSFGEGARFVVPTGNFGHALAGFYAKEMGLPIDYIVVATNSNDILHRFFSAGDYSLVSVVQTLAPAMDIQKASNFERYLFHLVDNDPARLRECMDTINQGTLRLEVTSESSKQRLALFRSCRATDDEIRVTIREWLHHQKYRLCPHTAVGVFAFNQLLKGSDAICMATAHPGKFDLEEPESDVQNPALPEQLRDLMTKEKRCALVDNDVEQIKALVRASVQSK
eukprot:c3601_g1_i1.p1 GENE.c3601_g1_i1~~c3601_g1_i1.p1  ORF type:complete len:480 (+),score=139.39 c3601_g1_i1:53-1492(+)